MAAQTLSTDDIAFGRAVLLATDSLGMSAEGAFWLPNRDRQWQFYLVTSLFDRVGARTIYMRLNEALKKKLSERETHSFMIYLGSPREHLAKAILEQAATEAQATDPIKITLKLGSRRQRAFVYRMTPQLAEAAAKTAQARFSRLYKETMAA